MRIFQILPTLAYGDAIGNDTRALKIAIQSMGYKTEIYADSVVPPLTKKDGIKIKKMPKTKKDDILIYHLSTGSKLNKAFADMQGRKIVVYHNVTPPYFFEEYDEFICGINEWALDAVEYLADKVDYCLADSDFNKKELEEKGYKCPIDVLPILIPFEDYKKQPDQKIIDAYSDGETNIIFTGRIAPNKKQEDVIKAFYCYKKYYNPSARLFLVGSYKPEEAYYQKLQKYVKKLRVKDVCFTGHIKFSEILAYYRIADVFMCMSEHEGFCVPLVESMFFDVPVIAYSSTAIPYTLGGSGLLLQEKDPMVAAKMIDILVNDEELKQKVLCNQRKRLKDFEYEVIKQQFKQYLEKFINWKVEEDEETGHN